MDLLTEETVIDYLRSRDVLNASPARATSLGGGVSNVVLAVESNQGQLVLKQSLERLRVQDEWVAPQRRILTEAAALNIAKELTPTAVPTVVDVDPGRFTLTIEHAPAGWTDWKTNLLDGSVDGRIAVRLGEVLATWHTATLNGRHLPAALIEDTETFEVLRLRPYHETVALRHPDLAPAIAQVVDGIRAGRRTLVHGDFSPKNVLVGQAGEVWVIDFEVAHFGDPAFDLAFLLSHLLLKAVHRKSSDDRFDAAATAFVSSYTSHVPAALRPRARELSAQVGCLLLARVDGKSPAEYLDDDACDVAWRLGVNLLTDPVPSIPALTDRRNALSIRKAES